MRAALLIAVLLALAGCGSSSPSTETKEGYAAALMSGLSKISSPNGDFTELAGQYRDAADELAKITPPPQVANAHARLVAGLRMQADQLERVVAAQTAVEAAEAGTVAQQAGQAWTQAFDEIRAQGYATVTAG